MTILLFLAVLFVLILVHEWGHFIVAKKTGMRVDEFGIGLPPKLFGKKWGETEYTLNALPIGGFVRIWGENYEQEFSPVSDAGGDGQSEALAEAGRGGTSTKNDSDRAFSARPKWAQALVLVAGVVMNILFAWVLLAAALMVGVPAAATEDSDPANTSLTIMSVLPDSPADAAGIPVGATITSLSSQAETLTLPSPEAFQRFIIENGTESVTVAYIKKEESFTTTLTAQSGVVSDDVERPAIGVTLQYTEIVREPLNTALIMGAESTVTSMWAITKGLSNLLKETMLGTADFSQVAGPIGIAGLVGDAAEFGLTSLMLLTAMISLNLAVINMVPIPALDGGRLLFVAIEAVTRRDIPTVWATRLNVIGFTFLMLLMILVIYGDITKLF